MLSSLKGTDILGGMSKQTYLTQLNDAIKLNVTSFNTWRNTLPTAELQNFARKVYHTNSTINTFDSYVRQSSQGLKGWASAFGSSMKTMALNMGAMVAVTLAVKAIVWAFDKPNVTFAEQKEKVDNLTEGYNNLQTELDNLKSKNPAEVTQSEKDRIEYLKYRLKLENQLLDIENRKLADSAIYGKGDITSGGIQSKTAGFDNSLITNNNDVERYTKELESIDKVRKNLSSDLDSPSNTKQLENLAAREQKINDKLDERKNKYTELETGYLKNAEDIRSFIDMGVYDNDEGALAKAKDDMQHNLDQAELVRGVISDIENSFSQSDFYTSDVFKEVEEDLKTLASQGKLTADVLADNQYSELNDLMKTFGITLEDLLGKLNDTATESEVAMSPLASAVDAYGEAVSALPATLAALEEVQGKVNDGYSFSYDEIEKLKSKYPELESAIYRTADGWGVEKEAVDLLYSSTGELGEQYLNVQNAMTEALNSDMAVRLSNLGIELEGIKTIADAYAAIAKAKQKAGAAQPLPNGASGPTLSTGNVDLKKMIGIINSSQDAIDFGETAERFTALQNKMKSLQSGRVSGGSPSKSSSGSGSKTSGSSSTTEAYKAEIDAYAKLQAELEKIQSEISTNEKKYDNTDNEKEKIALLQQRIALTQKEQSAIHNLNDARDKEVSNNVKLLKQKGFLVNYNPDSNELEIANLEHLNELKGKDQEATNDLIKKYEELISTTQSLNNENRESSNSWWDSYYNLSKYKDEVKDLNKQIYDNEVANQEHILELLNSRSGTEKEQVEIYTALQESALRRRQKLIDDDYVSNIEEIRSLENAWTSYYDNILEAKKKVLETQKESKDATINAITNLLDDQIKGIDDQIKALQKLNDERKEALDLQKAQAALDAAREQKNKSVLRKGQGYVYEADADTIKKAQEDLAEIQFNSQVSALEDEKEAIEEYKELWSSIPDAYEDSQNELIAEQELGANWEDKIADLRLSTYKSFKNDYFDLQDDIESKTEELNQHLNEEYINMVNIFQQMSTLMGKTQTATSVMSESDQAAIKAAQSAYNTAKAQGNTTAMESAHAMAESIRSKYSSDTDVTTSATSGTTNASSATKPSYSLIGSTKTGGSSSGGNSSLKAEYEKQLSLAEKYGGSQAYKDRLQNNIDIEKLGAGHNVDTYSNGIITNSKIINATDKSELGMSTAEIQKKNAASVKNNTNSLDKVGSGLKENTNATEYAGDTIVDAADTMANSNKETATSFSSALGNLLSSLGSSSSSNKSSSSSSSGESAEYKQWSTAYNTAKSQGNTVAMATAKAGMDASKKKAKGGIDLPADVYNVNEEGAELIIQPKPKQGNWVSVTNGTSVIPADISRNLMDFGSDPTAYLRQASANQIAGVTRIQNNNTTPIVNTYNIQATLPNVKDPYDFLDTLPQLARQYAAKR